MIRILACKIFAKRSVYGEICIESHRFNYLVATNAFVTVISGDVCSQAVLIQSITLKQLELQVIA